VLSRVSLVISTFQVASSPFPNERAGCGRNVRATIIESTGGGVPTFFVVPRRSTWTIRQPEYSRVPGAGLDADVVRGSEGANGAAQGTATIELAKGPGTIRFVESGGRVVTDGGGGRGKPPRRAGWSTPQAVLLALAGDLVTKDMASVQRDANPAMYGKR
jgi:hypothetical protein